MKNQVSNRRAKFIKSVIEEDIGRGDLFSRICDPKKVTAQILAKSDGVFAGYEYIETIGYEYGIEFSWYIQDGDRFNKGEVLLEIGGDSDKILSLERSILNIIMHASSIATLTSRYVEILKYYNCRLLDTRKTRPLLREFEKYAVRCGGGTNHRMGLDDCLMIKDTHLKTIDDLKKFILRARNNIPFTSKIEIECENSEMAIFAMKAGADIVMCDNMTSDEIRKVVDYRNTNHSQTLLEASGNITLDNIGLIADSGVDAISTGSIIHQATWPDMSMRIEND